MSGATTDRGADRSRLRVVGLVACGVLAGCGGSSSEQDKVEEVARDYSAALVDGDGIRACALLTEHAAQRLTSNLRRDHPDLGITDCASAVDAISANLPEEASEQITRADLATTVDGERATVTADGGSRPLRLVKRDGAWLISSGVF